MRAGLSGSSQGFNDKAHYLLHKFAYLVDNIALNVCLTIDLLCEPTGCMVHLGRNVWGPFIRVALFLNTFMVLWLYPLDTNILEFIQVN